MGGSLGGLHLTYAPALVQNSTVTQNTGGGITNTCGSLTLLNSTISYNSFDSGYGGGGIFLWQFLCWTGYPVANISYSTIFENSNPGWGRGNAIGTNAGNAGSVLLKNSILASPSHPSEAVCNNGSGSNLIRSLGHNVLGDNADVFGSRCADSLTATGDMVATNPLLGPTVDNGGPTPTDFPATDSPAVHGVTPGYCSDAFDNPVPKDQRGFARPCPSTIGSVEFSGLYDICLLYDANKAKPAPATQPIKLQLCDDSGGDLSSSTITLQATGITQTSTSITGPIDASGNANPDNGFRFDGTLGPTGGYIFNLSTKGLKTGTYRLNFTVGGDPYVSAHPSR
jgi:hypothetical protein